MRRSGPLRRSPVAQRTSPLPQAALKVAAQGHVPRKARRDTGPDRKTRAKVWEREQGCCASCGRTLRPGDYWSIQHRLARGQGGDSSLPNLILLCGSATSPGCHRLAEDRDEHMHARGFWVASWEDPRLTPVMIHGEQGGVTVWLSADGKYLTESPGAAA